MNVTVTLGRYMARTFFVNLLVLFFAMLGIIYLFDTVELIRRASKTEAVPLGLVLQMGLLKLPEVGQLLFPFAVLFGAMFTFWQLNRRSELVVLRSSGFSVWQFLAPVIGVAFLIGVVQISAINPVGALLVGKYEQLESKYFKKRDSQISLSGGGLWLLQSTDGRVLSEEDEVNDGYVILHAQKIAKSMPQSPWGMRGVTLFYFGENDNFLMRLDSDHARLEQGKWVFEDALIHRQNAQAVSREEVALPTVLSARDIEESFSSPESISFWGLPAHIRTLEQTGFDASRLYVYYHSLLAQPLFLVSMVLLAAIVSMRPAAIWRCVVVI